MASDKNNKLESPLQPWTNLKLGKGEIRKKKSIDTKYNMT